MTVHPEPITAVPRVRARFFITQVALGVVFAMGSTPTLARELVPGWSMKWTPQIGSTEERCLDPDCRQTAAIGQSKLRKEALTAVCLTREQIFGGLIEMGPWKISLNPPNVSKCQELFYAEPATKSIFWEAPSLRTGIRHPGQEFIDCTPGMNARGNRLCSSSFFDPPYGPDRLLNVYKIQAAFSEAGFLDAIQNFQNETLAKQRAAALQAYRAAYESATSLEDITQFEHSYSQDDPEGLILKLSTKKQALQLARYRDRFASLRSTSDIRSFVIDYKDFDPDNRLPTLRRNLADADLEERDKQAAADKRNTLEALERQFAYCKQEKTTAYETIDRERRIGNLTGYVNTDKLHQAGDVIVGCEELVDRDFPRYQSLGGTKSRADFK